MPRKAYIADVAAVIAQDIPGISSVAKGSEDGDLNICFVPSSGVPIEIGLLALDVSEYPSGNLYMISTISEAVPEGVNGALDNVQEISAGMSIPDLVAAISKTLLKVTATGSRDDPVQLDGASDAPSEDGMSEDESVRYSSDDEWGMGQTGEARRTSTVHKFNDQDSAALNRRIRADLRAAKLAGFKIGILNGLKADSVSSMLSISVQVGQLGLSDEAIQAWDLEPQQYIVLLVRYSSGYTTFDTIIKEAAKSLGVDFRIGFSNKYKPTRTEALAAFAEITKDAHKTSEDSGNGLEELGSPTAGFSNLFISSSLNNFINQDFVSLLKIRHSEGITWLGAKAWFNAKQSRMDHHEAEILDSYYVEDKSQSTLPEMLSKDHLKDDQVTQFSFPLIAAQFALRYLVRCTEYCLVCHDKIEEQFDALKPYVCSKPLCLYQYMSLGFGPSVEHEILTQPYVVDLLVSFCYASALNQRLREYPTGMSLMVPEVVTLRTANVASHYAAQRLSSLTPNGNAIPDAASSSTHPFLRDIKADLGRHEVIFEDGKEVCPVRNGEWVVVTVAGRAAEHYRVEDISLYPLVKLSDVPVKQQAALVGTELPAIVPATPATTPPPPMLFPAQIQVYNRNFDDMNDVSKAETILTLLETLPFIQEMRMYLSQQSRRSEPSLRAWKNRVSPAALGLLRWIIASNRSCIVQVDRCPGQNEIETSRVKVKTEQRIANITDNWVQFRFAQGAPDKEQRFLDALKANEGKLDPKFPTLFAWHGSPLQNWHSIIRSGLDFKETVHGRAFGHGVYHAMDQATSVGYAGSHVSSWQGSSLKINSAMSLNEIVNCPDQFQSKTPYLVVQHIDWIQCRYLMVQVTNHATAADPYGMSATTTTAPATATGPSSNTPILEVMQDPRFTAKSTLGKAIGVPQCAISTSRSFRADRADNTPMNKRRKHTSSISLVTTTSDTDDMEDLAFLLSDAEEDVGKYEGKGKEEDLVILYEPPLSIALKLLMHFRNSKTSSMSMTDFVPGSLDQSTLPMLEAPSYATGMATKALNRNLKEVLDIQKKTPLHELGWYIEQELISNIYQWIVELHSFDPDLQIAKDMKAAGITSIVLELRFGKDYPHSPPFVRVIRPRFLPFMNGGGGNVTAGGAMCMELLTNTGWSAVSSIESVLLQVRMAIASQEPRPARLETKGKGQQGEYGVGEAIEAYKRACHTHGWQIPPDFGDFATNSVVAGSARH
ncbi:Ubiquitin-conjugating enzyme E2 Q2 [Lachnellula suecica]|uniref:Ubiquitin-conjugating enzyme E2 Q2 n=1 Tax=Lachnellula suecica TaxID=602035 RepID=A0A8T9BWZ8_9HELO|nr:Ubiquitin-conjugating enzyme E2 Q2 [Lachnellula suecica]